jgi:nicotinate-nucleotide adenylyltransferase
MRLILFGGTFDPIHHGHLILARDALEALGADRVIFIPAAISPHKLTRIPASPEIRRAMVAAAIAGEERFLLDDRELSRPGPSYTYDTVVELRACWPDAEFLCLVGFDNVPALETWHRYAELEKLVEFIVLRRVGVEASDVLPGLARRLDLSSTEVRERVARGLSISYLVPEPVRGIIDQNQLYRGGNPPA